MNITVKNKRKDWEGMDYVAIKDININNLSKEKIELRIIKYRLIVNKLMSLWATIVILFLIKSYIPIKIVEAVLAIMVVVYLALILRRCWLKKNQTIVE